MKKAKKAPKNGQKNNKKPNKKKQIWVKSSFESYILDSLFRFVLLISFAFWYSWTISADFLAYSVILILGGFLFAFDIHKIIDAYYRKGD